MLVLPRLHVPADCVYDWIGRGDLIQEIASGEGEADFE